MITLIIEASGARPQTRVEVDESAFVGTCVAALVEKLGYPRVDTAGRPVVYQLRQVRAAGPLPNIARLAQARLRSGTHVVLEAVGANDATVPMETPGLAATHVAERPVPVWRNRRSFLAWTLAGVSLVGLCGGFTTAFARQYLFARSNGAGPPIPPRSQSPAAAMLRGANARFTFSAHQQTVRALGWSPDGTMLASGGDDALAIIWEPGGLVQQRIAHPAPVLALAWSPESQRLVTGAGVQVAFFKALTGVLLARSTHQHAANVSSLAWTLHNQMQVVSAGIDTLAVIWETVHYRAQMTFARHDTPIEAVSWGADGVVVASASQGGVVRVWAAASAQEIHGFYQDAQGPVRACAFAPAGSALAVGGDDGVVRMWNNGLLCQRQGVGNDGLMCLDAPQRLNASNSAVRSLAWSPDARYLASGSDDGSLTLWRVQQSPALLFSTSAGADAPVHGLAWSPDGNQIATASGTSITLWDLHG